MTMNNLLRDIKRHLPIILTVAGTVGTIATAIVSSKCTVKALATIDSEEIEKGRPLENDEILKAAWKSYIPAALTAIATAACIIGSGAISKKQQASLMSAYMLLANSYKRYRSKVKQIYGEEGHKDIINSIGADTLEGVEKAKIQTIYKNDYLKKTTLDWGVDDQEVKHLFYESYGRRYFTSTINRVLQAELSANYNLAQDGWLSINDFYQFLGIDTVEGGDLVGWGVCDGNYVMEFNHYRAQLEDSPDGLEALVIDYEWIPENDGLL